MSSTQADQPPTSGAPTPSKRASLKELLAEYGKTAGIVYVVLSVITFVASFVTVQFFGWKPQTVIGEAGVWTLAYVGYKLLQPVRIIALAVLMPLVVRLSTRRKPVPTEETLARPGEEPREPPIS